MKKYASYILILIILVGLFGPLRKVNADTCVMPGGVQGVWVPNSTDPARTCQVPPAGSAPAAAPAVGILGVGTTQPAAATAPDPNKSAFENEINQNRCSLNPLAEGTFYPGCFIQVAYGLFYVIPSWVLYVSAYFFNVLINITLSSAVLTLPFVSQAWSVVRDLSNIFFILILLYIAIKIILGIGGAGVKKMIANVIIIALLINFSMFFTEVIIDASNILALIFYNKVSVSTTDAQGNERQYMKTGSGEKDVAGRLVAAFDPTKLVSQDYLNNAKKQEPINGVPVPDAGKVGPGILIGMTLIAGLLMFFAAYCLFVVGLSFLGRLIELFVLIIFSPFAFMSYTLPELAKYEYIGWSAWFKRLITVSFMAPIFMFFLYFIFMLVKADIFSGLKTGSTSRMIESLLMIVLPALLILILLLKATDFAKKGAGKFGEMASTVGKMAGGLVVGAYAGGAAIAGRATIGRMGASMANSKWAQRWESHGFGGEYARRAAAAVGGGSFDARGVKIAGKNLASATGMNVGEAQKGGFAERREKDIKKRMARAKDLEVKEDQPLKQAVNKAESDLQTMLNMATKDLERIDRDLAGKRQEKADMVIGSPEEKAAAADIKALNDEKADIRNGKTGITVTSGPNMGKTIKQMQTQVIPDVKNDVVNENRRIRGVYANTTESGLGRVKNFFFTGGQSSHKGSREAAHKIRMETKIEDKGGGH